MISSLVVLIYLILMGPLIVTSLGDQMLGPGLWRVVNINQCPQEYPIGLEVSRRKVNRTHDGFNIKITNDKALNDMYSIRVDICKHVDGGCKPYHVLADASLPRFVQKYAAHNTRDMLARAGVDPPDFPVPAGEHSVQNYVFNYAELPADGIYGEFGVATYIQRGGLDAGCLLLHLEFAERDEDSR